jgi:HSP20 family protein
LLPFIIYSLKTNTYDISTDALRKSAAAHLKSNGRLPYSNRGRKTPDSIGDYIMVSITRYSPIDDAFNQLFRGFLVRPVGMDNDETAAKFRADIAENEKAYTVHAELPGVKKDDIHISIDGDQVAISAEVRREKNAGEVKDGERVLRSERYSGKFYRAFALGSVIDEEAASARYVDGVLELTLPKKAAAAAKRITIQ